MHSIADFGSPVKGVGAQIDSQQFKRWFANSKVVDGNGEPLVVWHATDNDFTVFDRARLGSNTDLNATDEVASQLARLGFWFNTKNLKREMAASKSMEVYLRIENPYETTLDELWQSMEGRDAQTYIEELKSQGFDGIALDDTEFGGKSFIAFEPTQIKSATNNIGTFDKGNDDINFARGGVGADSDTSAVFIAGTRVAHDAGRGEDTPGAIAASSELSRQGETPLSAYGSMRRLSLPMSELVWLRNKLAGPFAPARLGVNADVFGIVDKTDMSAIKAQLVEEGMFLCEDPEWVATHRASEVRDERKMSELALAGRLNDLADARVKGTAAGGQSAARYGGSAGRDTAGSKTRAGSDA